MPSLRTSTRSLLELTPVTGDGILLPSATKMLPSVALCQVEGWQAVMRPHERTEHTQLLTARQPHKPHDARDARPLNRLDIRQRKLSWQSLPGNQACRGEDFIRRDIARHTGRTR